MGRYLIVAHQTATEPRLVERIARIRREEPAARFALLVPATPVEHLATWETHETEAEARRRGERARTIFAAAGIALEEVLVGDQLPILAIEDELRERAEGYYDGVVLSTLPPGVSRWLALDAHSMAERRLTVPVVHLYEGGEAVWRSRRERASRRGWLTRALSAVGGGSMPSTVRRRLVSPVSAVMFGLLAVYVGAMVTLALAVDRWFFVNDVLALLVFATAIGAFVLFGVGERARSGGVDELGGGSREPIEIGGGRSTRSSG